MSVDNSIQSGSMRAATVSMTDATDVKPTKKRWAIAFILFLAVLSAFFDRISVAVLFTNTDFQNAMGTGFNPTLLGLLMTSFVFAYGCSGVLLSFVGDIYGLRRSLAIGTACWGVLMALMGGAGSFTAMLTLRILLGVAEGPQFSITNSLVKRWFPRREQARANSIWMVGSPLGSAIGFPLMIYLETVYGWRTAFYLLAALNLAVILPLVLFVLRDAPTMAPVPKPVAQAQPEAQSSYLSQVGLFCRDWRFWMLVIFNSAALIYLWGLNSWLPSYLIRERGFDPRQTGFYSFLPFFMMFLGEVLAAILSDRLGRRAIVCFVGLFMAGISMYAVSVVSDAQRAALLIAVSAFFWGAALPPLFALSLQILPPRAIASGVGMFNGIGNIIGALSPLVMGMLIASTGTFNAGLMVLVGATLLGSLAMLPLVRRY
ncbi:MULTISPECIES: MFS transporter [unclassified Beijerinckia]|uniref:MFS transporter n=1 Tax=unclassified Beijerinckia TaxID=2638183 RepID=UPI0008993F7C|nr:MULTISPECIES: MFS transporter [unclassified Beijerinckia]MDH7794040.1 sugar phosphate permease [Beijerinckia sp. GAS462]SEB51994.1 Sugar phosphate permease [Beijerinckia sp. 28-YEA-48]